MTTTIVNLPLLPNFIYKIQAVANSSRDQLVGLALGGNAPIYLEGSGTEVLMQVPGTGSTEVDFNTAQTGAVNLQITFSFSYNGTVYCAPNVDVGHWVGGHGYRTRSMTTSIDGETNGNDTFLGIWESPAQSSAPAVSKAEVDHAASLKDAVKVQAGETHEIKAETK